MRFDSAIFDLHGTLLQSLPDWAAEMDTSVAAALGVPFEDFRREWAATGLQRTTGVYRSPRESIEQVCRRLGVAVSSEQVARAVGIRLDAIRRNSLPRPGAVDLLQRLRAIGLKLGLLSNCDTEIPIIWPDTPLCVLFDDAVFSCEVGMAKPWPEIFELACRRLGTPPTRCVYVADNADGELDAALAAGMRSVRFRPPKGEPAPEGAERWRGPAIDSLPDLLDLLNGA